MPVYVYGGLLSVRKLGIVVRGTMAVIVAELQGGCPGAESMWPVYELRKCDVVRRSFAGSVADPRCDGCFGLFTLGRLADRSDALALLQVTFAACA